MRKYINKNPQISVIMSVRNGERYLPDAIKSILKQTYKDFEFLILDDGSDDNTWKIINRYHDLRIKKFKNREKKGLSNSLNILLKKSKGEYIARMDHDDISVRSRLKRQYHYLFKNKTVGIVGSWVKLIDSNSKYQGLKKYPITHKQIMKKIFYYNPIRHSAVMFRKKLIIQHGYYDENLDGAEDYDLWLRLSKHTQIANIKYPLLFYRIHPDRVSEREEKKVLIKACMTRLKAILYYKYSWQYLPLTLILFCSIYFPRKIKWIFNNAIQE